MKIRAALRVAICLTLATVPVFADQLYANGPTDGICDIQACTVDGWAAGFGFTIGNSFFLSSAANITGANFAFWLFPGDQVTSLSGEFGVYNDDGTYGAFTATAADGTLSQSFISSNQFGFDIDLISVSGLNINVPAGTSWITLTDGATNTGDQFYWDENNGPSLAFQGLGTIPSESFNLEGSFGATGTTGTVPEPSSIMLFGCGILSLAGVLRRKLF